MISKTFPRRASVAFLLMGAIGIVLSIPAFSYLPMFTRGGGVAQPDHWDFGAFPVVWTINPATGTNISGTRAVADVVQASFNTWTSAPNTAIALSRGPDTASTSEGFDGQNLICFVCTGDFTKESSTLAVTFTTSANATGQATKHGTTATFVGQLIDGDILFNPNTKFTTGGGTAQDLQTIATHEIGHFFGLDHSAVVRATMFPFAPVSLNTLGCDDVAGISSLYPKSAPDVAVGNITGTIRFTSGSGVFGAHVFADSVTNNAQFGGTIRKTPIGAISRPDGTYTIGGAPLDSFNITAEPLDQPVDSTNLPDFASAFGQSSLQTNFNTRYH